jgi:gamma-butyrobetaine dioxygenase
MKLGKCVIPSNGRMLHACKTFQVTDAGKERWLRGAYVSKDPFMSNLRMLAYRFSTANDLAVVNDTDAEAAAAAAS